MIASQNYYPESRMFHAAITGVMGTRLDAVILGLEQSAATEQWQRCFAQVLELESIGSKFRYDSEVTKVNRAEPLSLIPVSDRFRQLLIDASCYRAKTHGAFDVTVEQHGEIAFDKSGNLIVPSSGIKIDVGGYLKGVAVDAIGRELRRVGVENAYVDFGGSTILGLGTHPAGDGWQVSITDPYTRRSLGMVTLHDSSLSTSGNTPGYNGHIVNPFTGRVVTGNRLSVVHSTSAIDAEVLSTTWLVVDRDVRADILKKFDTVIEEFVYN